MLSHAGIDCVNLSSQARNVDDDCVVQFQWDSGMLEIDFKNVEHKEDKSIDGCNWKVYCKVFKVMSRIKKWTSHMKHEEIIKSRLIQLEQRINKFETTLREALQTLVQRVANGNTSNVDKQVDEITESTITMLGERLTQLQSGKRRELSRDDLLWMHQGPRKKRTIRTLRSNNAFIDAALVDEDGTDGYEELESFIVCTDGKLY